MAWLAWLTRGLHSLCCGCWRSIASGTLNVNSMELMALDAVWQSYSVITFIISRGVSPHNHLIVFVY